jgi:hypothetical protein
MDTYVMIGIVIVVGAAIYYGLGKYLQTDRAINKAKDLKAALVEIEPRVPEDMREVYDEALAAVDCYISGASDGNLTLRESMAFAWAGYRLGAAVVRAVKLRQEEAGGSA